MVWEVVTPVVLSTDPSTHKVPEPQAQAEHTGNAILIIISWQDSFFQPAAGHALDIYVMLN